MNEVEIKEAVEDFVMTELKKVIQKRMNEVIEDALVEIMRQVVIRIYKNGRLKSVNFDIEIRNDSN